MKKFFLCILIGIIFIMFSAILVGGIGVKKYISDNKSSKKDIKSQYDSNIANISSYNFNGKIPNIKVYITKSKTVKELNIEDYVIGVVSSEMPAEFNIEALKAQAVAARTFAVAHMEQFGGSRYKNNYGADVCDTVQCQVYTSKEDRIKTWPSKEANQLWDKVTKAVQNTKGQVLTYNHSIIKEPYYFAVSSGKTESLSDITGENSPYLKSVYSPGEDIAPKYKTSVKFSYSELVKVINEKYPKSDVSISSLRNSLKILKKNKSGSVNEISVGKITMTGVSFRSMCGLNSTNFNLEFDSSGVKINCIGYGHGIGMSQWGARVMADAGNNYKDILIHYYQGIEIEEIS